VKTLRDLFLSGKTRLERFPSPALEAKRLLCASLSLSEEAFFSHPERTVTDYEEKVFNSLLEKRLSGMPLAYVLGEVEFWSLPFRVPPGVVIPRPETELLIERVLDLCRRKDPLIVDIGTGCGNIAVSLARELPGAALVATDIDAEALGAARRNAARHGVANIRFCRGDLYSALDGLGLEGRCSFVVSNPPYVSRKQWENLEDELRRWEPRAGLVGGDTGLEIIARLVTGAPAYLEQGGFLCMEIGFDQRERVLSLFRSGWSTVECHRDLSGWDRVLTARLDRN